MDNCLHTIFSERDDDDKNLHMHLDYGFSNQGCAEGLLELNEEVTTCYSDQIEKCIPSRREPDPGNLTPEMNCSTHVFEPYPGLLTHYIRLLFLITAETPWFPKYFGVLNWDVSILSWSKAVVPRELYQHQIIMLGPAHTSLLVTARAYFPLNVYLDGCLSSWEEMRRSSYYGCLMQSLRQSSSLA